MGIEQTHCSTGKRTLILVMALWIAVGVTVRPAHAGEGRQDSVFSLEGFAGGAAYTDSSIYFDNGGGVAAGGTVVLYVPRPQDSGLRVGFRSEFALQRTNLGGPAAYGPLSPIVLGAVSLKFNNLFVSGAMQFEFLGESDLVPYLYVGGGWHHRTRLSSIYTLYVRIDGVNGATITGGGGLKYYVAPNFFVDLGAAYLRSYGETNSTHFRGTGGIGIDF